MCCPRMRADLEAQNPDIQVELNIPAQEDYKTNIRMWLTSDNPPDVLSWFAGARSFYFFRHQIPMISNITV